MLLCNIGANCRLSSVTIQSLMQGASTPAETERCALTGNEIIDLIAMIYQATEKPWTTCKYLDSVM